VCAPSGLASPPPPSSASVTPRYPSHPFPPFPSPPPQLGPQLHDYQPPFDQNPGALRPGLTATTTPGRYPLRLSWPCSLRVPVPSSLFRVYGVHTWPFFFPAGFLLNFQQASPGPAFLFPPFSCFCSFHPPWHPGPPSSFYGCHPIFFEWAPNARSSVPAPPLAISLCPITDFTITPHCKCGFFRSPFWPFTPTPPCLLSSHRSSASFVPCLFACGLFYVLCFICLFNDSSLPPSLFV